ncbi:unnamed protein product, partial [Ilex paraguariensis]
QDGLQDYSIIIETDSKLLVDMVMQKIKASWKFWNILDRIASILQNFNFQFQHTYHQGNIVAYSLAKQGVSDRVSKIYDSNDGLPISIRLLMQQDTRKIRNLRKRIIT